MFQSMRAFRQRVASMRAPALPSSPPDRPAPDCAHPPEDLPRIDIPVRMSSPDAAERGRIRTQGRYLARQDDWDTLSRGLREADADRALTVGGTPVVRLLAEGAHSDALDSAYAAISRNDPTTVRGILYSLGDSIERAEEDPWLAYAVALAHVAVARAWDSPSTPDPLRRDARAQHMETAHRLIAPFDPIECDSPAIAALRCTLLEVEDQPGRRVIDDYEDLIDLDPGCAEHMRALGRDLTPTRYGSWERLDREARRTAARVADVWGMGGYAWVWFDALSASETRGFAYVDAELFVEGLHDILARRDDQHMTNLLAAYCGQTLAGAVSARSPRARISDCFGWIVQDHLREIHPDVWARSSPLPYAADAVEVLRIGETRAMDALAELFAHQLHKGRKIRIRDSGITLDPTPCASCALAPCAALTYPHRDMRDGDTPCLT